MVLNNLWASAAFNLIYATQPRFATVDIGLVNLVSQRIEFIHDIIDLRAYSLNRQHKGIGSSRRSNITQHRHQRFRTYMRKSAVLHKSN